MPRSGGQASSNTNAEKINIYIKAQDGSEVACRIQRKAKLSRLMRLYCQKKQVEFRTARFIFNSNRVLGKYTAEMLNMKDGDQIDCMLQQSGGGFYLRPTTTLAESL